MTDPAPDRPELEVFAFNVGDAVRKPSGYPFNGFVVSCFHNRAGFARYVVEHKTETGMLHIYSRKQLEARTLDPAPRGDVEAKARELLAAEMGRLDALESLYTADGYHTVWTDTALRAITAALSIREGREEKHNEK